MARLSPNAIVRSGKAGPRRLFRKQLPGQGTKYGSKWTYFDGQILHTTGKDCVAPIVCGICSKRSRANANFWFPSIGEAKYAQSLVFQFNRGEIGGWRRSASIVVLDGPEKKDRVTYKPDFDVWAAVKEEGGLIGEGKAPDWRVEFKGSKLAMSRDVVLRVRLYRALVREGKQPPLKVIDHTFREISL